MDDLVRDGAVPAGYQQTEVGLIPSHWRLERVRDVASIATGKRNTQDQVVDGRYPFFVRSQQVERINSYSFDGEAVLTAGDGVGTGKVFHYINGRFDYHQRVYKLSHFAPGVVGYYFFLYFSANFYNRIIAMTAKSSVDSVRLETIAGMALPVPPLEEQHLIATALRDADELINAMDQLILKKRDLKQAAMQQLITGQTRLPGFNGNWAELKISQIVRNIIDYRGRTPRKLGMQWGGGRIRALSALNVKMGYLDLEADAYFGSDALYQRWMANGHCRKGDLVFTTEAPLGNVALIPDEEKYILSQRVILLQLKPEAAVSAFVLQLMMSRPFQMVLVDNATGSTASGIKRSKFEQLSIYAPDVSEQAAIAAVLSDMDAEVTALEQRRDKTRLLKQGMMQELLTGRIRLV